MLLTKQEEAMVRGDFGPGIQRCMQILVRFGNAVGAEKLVPIASGHTMPKEPPELLAKLTEGVTATGAPTTLHAIMDGYSPESYARMKQPEAFLRQESADFGKRRDIYLQAGFLQTYTCLPTLVGNLPRKGDLCSWIGSGCQVMLNSLIGARCNRDGTVMTLAAAIAGRTPYYGLLLDENRGGEVLVRFAGLDIEKLTPVQLGAIGYYVGGIAGSRNVVIDGMPRNTPLERLKYLMAPLAVSGSVGLCHIVGLTPEARTLEEALQGKQPAQTVTVGFNEINGCIAQYAQPDGAEVDMAVFGCPHCMIPEVKHMASLLDGRKLSPGKHLWIGLPHQHHKVAQMMGYTQPVENAGGVFASSCMSLIPNAPVPDGVKTLATNSFKAAHYISRLSKGRVKVVIGDIDRCIAAITGQGWKGGVG